MSILVVGSIAYDDVETPEEKRSGVLGGSATYFCHAASFFSPSKLVGVVGTDFKQEHIDMLKGLNVDLEGMQIKDGKTFAYGCRYEEDMNVRTTLFTDLNVFETFEPTIPESWKDSEIVFLANIHPDLQHHVLDQVTGPKLVAADSMNLWIDIAVESLKRLITRIDLLVINDEEAKMLTGQRHLPKAAADILAMGPKQVVIKRGEYGVTMFSKDSVFMAPAYPVADAVDPTGAGDCFAGGMMGYLAKYGDFSEASMRRAIIHGSSVAGYAVEGFGFDRLLTLTMDEIVERVHGFKELTKFDI
jgi:sugar/nucleoside kinase (ribokinase family)